MPPTPGESPSSLLQKFRQGARRLRQEGVALWLAARHPDTPWYAKAAAFVVLAYALSPIDLIPDVIPVLGLLDDLVLLPFGIWLALRLIPAPVMAQCRREAAERVARGEARPRSRWGVLLVVGFWVVVAIVLGTWLGRRGPAQ